MDIRLAQASDLPELANIYHQTVMAIAPQKYTPQQVEAWASHAADADQFRQFILAVTTYVAVDETGILGFAGISPDGYVASVYVRGDRIHQGIGSTLMEVIQDHATRQGIERLHAAASEFSLGLFRKFGFQVYATEIAERQGVPFERYLVERLLSLH